MGKLARKLSALNDRTCMFNVGLLRVLIGAIFIFAGFVKCIDPTGFVIKIQEYLNVWGIDWLWHETVVCIAVTIAMSEFCAGFMILTGSLRRAACWLVLMMMTIMLPLTAYIAIASPVDDCGCFGDAYVLSNTATFIKNIFITLGTIYLLFNNSKVPPMYPPLMQWMPILASVFYCLILAFVGLTVQPLMDFRPFKVGTQLIADDDYGIKLLYEKGGVKQEFNLDALPDSTWTYVGRSEHQKSTSSLAIYDGDDDVTTEVVETEGAQILLVVPDISNHVKARASMANNVNDYITSHGGSMIALIGADQDGIEQWRQLAKPNFNVYTADESTLKSLVRGDAGLVYLYNDTIKWKRNIFAISGEFPDFNSVDDELDSLYVIDSGQPLTFITAIYIGILLVLFLLGLIRIRRESTTADSKTGKMSSNKATGENRES